MILVAYCHGLRASEVVALRGDDIDNGFITVSRKKGSLKTTQPLLSDADPLLDELSALSEFAGKKQKLFPIGRQHFWRLVQRYAAEAGLPEHKRHPHMLKHTIAMQVIHSAGIHNTKQYLGHKSGSSTLEYLKVSDADAAAAVAQALKVSSPV